MSSTQTGIYQDETFRDVDIGAIMREGHPDIEEGDEHVVNVIRKLRRQLQRPLRVLDVGAGSGHLSWLLAREFQDGMIVANEIAESPITQARSKLAAFSNAQVFGRPFSEWDKTVDAVISWGTHHHLGHGYLDHVRRVLSPDGLLVIGDEMCPEYLTASDQQRLRQAKAIEIVDGYIFDRADDIENYRRTGMVPEWNLALEKARRKALWKWYKFVGDYAVAKDCWTVLITELQIARDDLITNFAEEHKTSPYLLQCELELNGFTITEKAVIGKRAPELQSFVVYTCNPGLAGLSAR